MTRNWFLMTPAKKEVRIQLWLSKGNTGYKFQLDIKFDTFKMDAAIFNHDFWSANSLWLAKRVIHVCTDANFPGHSYVSYFLCQMFLINFGGLGDVSSKFHIAFWSHIQKLLREVRRGCGKHLFFPFENARKLISFPATSFFLSLPLKYE